MEAPAPEESLLICIGQQTAISDKNPLSEPGLCELWFDRGDFHVVEYNGNFTVVQ